MVAALRMMKASLALWLGAIALVACAPRATTTTTPAPPVPTRPAESGDISPGEVTTVAEGLAAPWSIAFSGDVALISERDTARIVEVSDEGALHELGVVPGVEPRGEGGLLDRSRRPPRCR
ncbi:hypothetical protein AAY78_04745 [Microbacterium sp. Ag1]|nr:hypothetical protein AAY78_04745 [Microbacterium sp. Ag1]